MLRIVLALGGNALLPRGATPDTAIQVAKVRLAVEALRPLALAHELVLTHGNGPQVGLLAAATAGSDLPANVYPLDTLVAQTQGMIGFWITQALTDALPGRPVAGLLTRTLVDPDDPAMSRPTKFVGAVLGEQEAQMLAAERAWTMARDGEYWRRVVPSPAPRSILEADVVASLLDRGTIVVCAGGGGVAVRTWQDGTHEGVEAVVDKDLASAVLAEQIGDFRVADAGVFLRDKQQFLLVVVGDVERGDGFFPADKERHDDVRVNDDVAQRQDGEGVFLHQVLLPVQADFL